MNVLNRPTLILNKSWQAIHVRNVAKAITLVWLGKAKIVDPTDYTMYNWEDWSLLKIVSDGFSIKTISGDVRLPEVIVLSDYNKIPEAGVAFNRRNLYVRDKYSCQYCAKVLRRDDLTLDHVMPRSRGGPTTWENCVVACYDCNHRKANRTPKEAHMKLLSKPKKPRWIPTFHGGRILDSWEKFVDEMYWSVPLEE